MVTEVACWWQTEGRRLALSSPMLLLMDLDPGLPRWACCMVVRQGRNIRRQETWLVRLAGSTNHVEDSGCFPGSWHGREELQGGIGCQDCGMCAAPWSGN